MSEAKTVELTMAVHVDKAWKSAVLLSDNGEEASGKWIPRSLMTSFHRTGKTTRGFDSHGQAVVLEVAHLTIPEWKAKQAGLI